MVLSRNKKNTCFCQEIRKISILSGGRKRLIWTFTFCKLEMCEIASMIDFIIHHQSLLPLVTKFFAYKIINLHALCKLLLGFDQNV